MENEEQHVQLATLKKHGWWWWGGDSWLQPRLRSPLSLVDGVNVCAVVGLPVHTAAPYSRSGGGDGVVLDDLLLGAHWSWTACRTALWT